MAPCCDPRGCERFFTPRFARRTARRYRKKGLDKTARVMVEFLASCGIQEASVLEIGGGVGEVQLELLKRGADRTLNLELSPAYEDEAVQLLREANLANRAHRQLHDIATNPDGVEPADVVVLHRVVCCYPDYERLLVASAAHARRLLVFSYPPRNGVSRLFVGVQNVLFRILGREFRTFVHPPSEMLAAVSQQGFRQTLAHGGLVWQVAGMERQAEGKLVPL
jgi:hypothetical protein